ncbi:MAG: hypothetical protein ABSA07_09235 [Acidimicrobiales bacterium]|jgi:hypothetical protein
MAQLDDRELATQLFNRCWELLESMRDDERDVELLTTAFSSRFHWLIAGETEQWIVSDWMVARAAAATGDGELALRFAKRAHSTAQESEIPDWLVASCAEGVARAYAAMGDAGEFSNWSALAARLIEVIADPEDRALIASQLAELETP